MIKTDRDALICDFAETYHILNMWAHPVPLVATLACGLGDNSRIRRKMSGMKTDMQTFLIASAVDRLSLLVWTKTEDATKGRNRPDMIAKTLIERDDDPASLSIEEFERFREMNFKGGEHG